MRKGVQGASGLDVETTAITREHSRAWEARARAGIVVWMLGAAIGLGCSSASDSDHGSSGTGGKKSATSGSGGSSASKGTGGAGHAAGSGASAKPSTDAGAAGKQSGGDSGAETYPALDPAQIGSPSMVASGFMLAESPVWDRCEKRLLFPDVSASVIHTLDADGNVGTLAMNTSMANGMAWDVDGTSLILAQMGGGGKPGHLARLDASGAITVLEPAGSTLHTPDDVVVRSDGSMYFTDGDFPPASTNLLNAFNPLPVYMLNPGAAMLVNGGMVIGPNGIELSPDEKTLYVDAYGEGKVYAFDVADDGTPSNKRALPASLNAPDSLCLDAAGNLYVGTSGGLTVLRPDGSNLTMIAIPSGATTNCTFGGDDGTTLYATAWTSIWTVENMPIPGLDWVVGQKRQKCM